MARERANLAHLEARVVGAPLAIGRGKLDVILGALRDRVRLDAAPVELEPDGDEPDGDEPDGDEGPSVADGIATIPVRGTLVARSYGLQALCGLASYERLAAQVAKAMSDPAVEGVLLDVDSPGGEVAGLFEAAGKILGFRGEKPMCAVAAHEACSAAYALAASTDRVFVSSSSTVGSIGVVALHVDESQKDAKDGRSFTYLARGERKTDGNPHEPLSDPARAALMGQIDRAYGAFVDHVARARGIPADAVRATEAGLFTGEQAVAAGLADATTGADGARAWLSTRIAEARAMTKQIEDLTRALTEAQARATSAEKARAEFADRLAKLEAERDEQFLSAVKAKAVEFQSPIEASKLERLASLMKAGDRATAQALAEAWLETAAAKAQKKAEPAASVALAGTKPTPTNEDLSAAGAAAAEALLGSRKGARGARKGK